MIVAGVGLHLGVPCGTLVDWIQVFDAAYFFSQVLTNKYGSGLHLQNVPHSWLQWHWKVRSGPEPTLPSVLITLNSGKSAGHRIMLQTLASKYLSVSASLRSVSLAVQQLSQSVNLAFSSNSFQEAPTFCLRIGYIHCLDWGYDDVCMGISVQPILEQFPLASCCCQVRKLGYISMV